MAQIVMTANAFVWSFICMPHTPHDDAAAKRVQKSPRHHLPCTLLCVLLHDMPLHAVRLDLLPSLPEDFWPVTCEPEGLLSTVCQLIFDKLNSDVHLCCIAC